MEYQKGDHFIVEDLLDFSNDDVEALVEELAEGPDVEADVAQQNFSAESSSATAGDSCNFSGELCEPQYDELAELEWLSNFVEESLSSEDLQKLHLISAAGIKSNTSSSVISSNTLPTLKIKTEPINSTTVPSPSSSSVTNHTNSHTTSPTSDPNLLRPLPSKTRSKRSRSAAPSNWSSHLIPLSPTYPNPNPNYPNPNPNSIPLKKPKKKQFAPESLTTEGRRCLHCQTDKTPQWRTGPMGPKTLCNACGVRYKSGRLVPEYRPAASPTFIVSKHSNSHRKVLELRRQKEVELDHFDVQHQQLMIHHGTAPIRGQNGEDFLIHRSGGMDYRQLI